eukprot:TRINITY_DN28810_c0_g1_i1.p1 TRINITY_DN28810_c0_g1~~TRINITY_DN28810_c0_g1_i1.p1  ORF type:complete len:1087 (+),score=497.58 TRINITY_DN28810_c0_g1_i1:45-3263(+)
MGKHEELNQQLSQNAYLEGASPSAADAAVVKEIFGDNMRAMNWAARMATLYAGERKAMSTVAGAPEEKKEAKEAPKKKPVFSNGNAVRHFGGGEGLTDGSAMENIRTRELQWPIAKVRQTFVDFMSKEKGQTFVPSSSSVPLNDPTLLFANAGMNQFKSIFLGTVEPNDYFATLKGAVNSQKCIRAGGKHNDLDDVGKDTYHHTFFEMLGNWSFGDYFKTEAIDWAWHLMTKVYGLPGDRLYATYFEGVKELGLEPDLEAKNLWLKYLPESHILPGNMKDNFWEMGDVGPCGPCSEIHYDRIGGRNAADLVNQDDPMVLELWNLVFMTHTRTEKGLMTLPNKHVDTGMGLERIASVLQGVYSNYDTDAWWRIFDKLQELSGYEHSYYSSSCPEDAVVAYRVCADHIRTITVALCDGGVPDNNGRGYVLRRIIRRAVRYGKEFLKAPLGFFSKLSAVVAEELSVFFEELKNKDAVERITAIVYDEEVAFDKTWNVGLKHFNDALQNMKKAGKKVISGEDSFVLHDRYGFPRDLTMIMAEKAGCEEPFIDVEKFDQLMEDAKVVGGNMKLKQFLSVNNIDILQKDKVPATVDDSKYIWEKTSSTITGIVDKAADVLVDELGKYTFVKPKDKKEKVEDLTEEHMCVIVDETCFYYESGGQIWDTGYIKAKDGSFSVKVNKVLSMGGYICHIGKVESGIVKKGAEVSLEVDYDRRLNVGANHTVTHQLNHVLREVLEFQKKSHLPVNQKGSFVEADFMRFDFSWNEKLSQEDILATEEILNNHIKEKRPVYDKLVPLDEAMKIKGLRAMFGEKYPDPVRVVSIGKPVEDLLADPTSEEWKKYSIEFCGGTHLKSLEEIQEAVVVGEEALMKGVRRVTVLTREPARKAVELMKALTDEHDKIFSQPHDASNIDDKIKAIQVHSKKIGDATLPIVAKARLQKTIETEVKALHAEKKTLVQKIKAEALEYGNKLGEEMKGQKVVIKAVNNWGADRDALNEVSTAVTKACPEAMVFLTACDAEKGKGLALTVVPKAAGKSAVEWIKTSCGKGGGNAEKAQTGFVPADEAKVLEAALKWTQ